MRANAPDPGRGRSHGPGDARRALVPTRVHAQQLHHVQHWTQMQVHVHVQMQIEQ